jgi:hypothetical protein
VPQISKSDDPLTNTTFYDGAAMSKGFNYSKWDNIELSDDEDDVHPNIDKESWFRLKHRSRVEREEKEENDKKKMNEEVSTSTSLI